jgi:hypothetical protein
MLQACLHRLRSAAPLHSKTALVVQVHGEGMGKKEEGCNQRMAKAGWDFLKNGHFEIEKASTKGEPQGLT